VALVFPMFMFSVVIIRSVILFKRGAIRNKEVQFCFALESCFEATQDVILAAAAAAMAQAGAPRDTACACIAGIQLHGGQHDGAVARQWPECVPRRYAVSMNTHVWAACSSDQQIATAEPERSL
jgi:hypothetical protein